MELNLMNLVDHFDLNTCLLYLKKRKNEDEIEGQVGWMMKRLWLLLLLAISMLDF